MKNVLILGCGRSGTSLVAGCLAKAGYFMGDNYIPAEKDRNLYGFFEDEEINKINEDILFRSYPKKSPFNGEWIFSDYVHSWRWLARLPLNAKIFSSKEIKERIKNIVREKNFCYKDTRFGYTFPVWKNFLKNTFFVCVFRCPSSTASSIVRECRNASYLKDMNIDFETSLDLWKLVYSHILKHFENGDFKQWLFVHYNQLFEKKFLDKLAKFTGAKVDYKFPDKKLRKIDSCLDVSEEIEGIYDRLCGLANYSNH
jgi:hypothetical protein